MQQVVKLWDAAEWGATPLLAPGLACTSIPAASSTQSTWRKARPRSEGSDEISHLKWCPWGVSLKLKRGGVINLGTPGRKCKQPTWFFSALSSLKCLTISLKRKIYLVVLIFLAITSSFPELLQFSSEYQNATHGHHVTVEKEEMTLGCQSQYWPVLECLFVLRGGCRELTKEKQSSSVSKHKLKMISFSAALVSTVHKPRAARAPGVFMVRLSHKHAILQNNTQSHPNIKQTR